MRAPFQILAIPYRVTPELQFCVFHRADIDQYQFVAGGGENDEKPVDAAIREICEETSINTDSVIQLTSMAYVPANVIAQRHRKLWPEDTFVIPEYTFAFECKKDVVLSDEHSGIEWLSYDDAMQRLTSAFCRSSGKAAWEPPQGCGSLPSHRRGRGIDNML